uniref:porin n=1 Tax=Alistipes sp. TaxID=1872444 RepID=UPI0040575D0C
MTKKLLFSTLLFTLLFTQGIYAQVGAAEEQAQAVETEELNARIAELEARLDRQAARSERWGKIVDKLPKISGFFQAGYTWSDEDGGSSQFEIPYARISLTGDISKKFDYKLQVELASPKLIDAYVRWKANPSFNVQLGQFHVPFSLEGPLSPTKLEAIGNPRVVSAICKQPDTRDLGLMFYGNFAKVNERHLFEYAVGVFQGEGKNKADANKSKDVIGRLKFFPVENLCLTGSFSYGEHGAEFTQNQRATAGFEWKPENWIIRSEYMWHKQGTTGSALHNDGVYVVAMRQIKKFAPVVRYSFYNQEVAGAGHEETSDFTVGVNYTPLKPLKFQLNYTFTHASVAPDFNTVGFLATVMF